MKGFLISLSILLSPTVQSNTHDCQHANDVLQSVRSEQRNGYSIKRGNKLACIERQAKQLIKQFCIDRKNRKPSKISIKKRIAERCSDN